MYLLALQRSLIILIDPTMTRYSEKMMISYSCMRGFMPNLHKKSWMVYILHVFDFQVACRRNHSVISNHNHMCGLLNIGPDYFLMAMISPRLAWEKKWIMSYLEIERTRLKKSGHLKILLKIDTSFAAKGTEGFMWTFFVC